jgi:hypothetical protein
MKHVYPPRHPASLDTPAAGPPSGPHGNAADPAQAHDQAGVAPQPRATNRDAARGSADTDRSTASDPLRSDDGAPRRGPDTPLR